MYGVFTYIWLIFMVNVGNISYMDGVEHGNQFKLFEQNLNLAMVRWSLLMLFAILGCNKLNKRNWTLGPDKTLQQRTMKVNC